MKLSIVTKQKYKQRKKRLGILNYTPHKLSKELGAYLRTRRTNPLVYTPLLLNWGCSTITNTHKYLKVLNNPSSISNSVDKIKTIKLLLLNEIPVIEHSIIKEDAERWIEEGERVVCRTLTKSSGGKGIVIAKNTDELVDAPLYTVYFNKNKEYRYHIFNGKLIDVQQKKRLSSENLKERGFKGKPTGLIMNTENGYIFARKDVKTHEYIEEMCIKAIEVLGLDFGAIDVLVKENEDGELEDVVVCEVNSAPGLTGTTFNKYVEAIKEWVNEQS